MKNNTNLKAVNSTQLTDLSVEQLTSLYRSEGFTAEQKAEFNALPLWTETKMVKPSDVFGSYWKGMNEEIEIRVNRHPECDSAPSSYIPDPDLLMDTVYYVLGKRDLALGIYGETGTGKSEMPRYVSDKLNIPMKQVSLTAGSREDALCGSYQIKNGETYFDYGVVPLAYDQDSVGYILVVNEIDKGCDNVVAKMHDIADSKPFMVEDTGKVVFPHDKFRLIVTGQTSGNGDPTGRYNVDRLDRAFTARLMWSRANYPKKEIIASILEKEYPRLINLIPRMADYYELCVAALDNSRLEAEGNSELIGGITSESINTPVSIRLMKGWANIMVNHGKTRSIFNAFQRTIYSSAEADDQYVLKMFFDTCFGESGQHCPDILEVEKPIVESEIQDLSNLKFPVFLKGKNVDERKIWAIACDRRGVHMLESEHGRKGFKYFYKPISEFDNGIQGCSDYCNELAQKKESQGFKHHGMITYNPETKQYARV